MQRARTARLTLTAHRVMRRVVATTQGVLKFDPISRTRLPQPDGWVRLGSAKCGWFAPVGWTFERPVALCVGAGEDVTFDLELAERFGARVFIFDPTPRAVAHVESAIAGKDNVSFHPWAIWSSDGHVEMFEPADSAHVSHSIVDLQRTGRSFTAVARSIPSISTQFNLTSIDLVKLDVEGAEYAILSTILESGARVGIIEVEFDELSIYHKGALTRVRETVRRLESCGYELVIVDRVTNYVFVNREYKSWAIGKA